MGNHLPQRCSVEAFSTDLSDGKGAEEAGPRKFHAVPLLRASEVLSPARCSATVELGGKCAQKPMLGFGAAVTESAAVTIWGHPRREEILDDLFLPMARGGAGLSCLRICMGSSDFSLCAETHQDEAGGRFDASREERAVIPVLKAAKQRNPHLALIASPWSAPGWMKEGGKLNGGSLKEEFVHQWCYMFVRFLLFFQSRGLPIYAVTLQNEPFHETEDYPSMLLPAAEQAALANALVPLLRANDLATRVLGHDHNYDLARHAVDFLRSAPGADGTAWHAYAGDCSSLENEAIQQRDVFVTEQTAHTRRGRDADFRRDAEWMLQQVLLGPVLRGSRCGLAWNLALDDTFGPVLPGGPSNCRGLVEAPRGGGTHERSPEFYGLAHLCHASSAVQERSCWRVVTSCSKPDTELVAVGFVGGNGMGSLVLHNKTDVEMDVKVKWQGARGSAVRLLLAPHALLSAAGLQPARGPRKRALAPPADEGALDVPRVPVRLVSLPHRRFALRCRGEPGRYLAAHGALTSCVYQSGQLGNWEKWHAIEAAPRAFALRSWHGTFIGHEERTLCQVPSLLEAVCFALCPAPGPGSSSGMLGFISDQGCLTMPEEAQEEPQLRHCCPGERELFAVVAC